MGTDEHATARGELSAELEEELVEAMLHHQVDIDPDQVGAVLDVAAVGLVNDAWRNSPVEDWHAGDGPLSDGDMLRINSHTTHRVRDMIRRWRTDCGIDDPLPHRLQEPILAPERWLRPLDRTYPGAAVTVTAPVTRATVNPVRVHSTPTHPAHRHTRKQVLASLSVIGGTPGTHFLRRGEVPTGLTGQRPVPVGVRTTTGRRETTVLWS